MRKYLFLAAAFMLPAAILISCNNTAPASTASTTNTTPEDLVKRGEYLVTTMGCNDCHSPKRMGPNGPELIPELLLSGHHAETPIPKADLTSVKNGYLVMSPDLTAAYGPWGTSYAANLTSDSTGIGLWTETQFATALKKGKAKGLDSNRMLLPPMPWTNFVNIKDEDLKAMFAYLKATKAVKNVVPPPVPPTQP